MAFKEDLEQICGKVDGSFAASVMGSTGSPSRRTRCAPGRSGAAEPAGGILRHRLAVRQAAEALQMGKANEVSIRTEKLVAVARPLTPDYFVVLALAPEGNVGRARYELRVAGPKLAAQL